MKSYTRTPAPVVLDIRESGLNPGSGSALTGVLRPKDITKTTRCPCRRDDGATAPNPATRRNDRDGENGALNDMVAEAEVDKAPLHELAEARWRLPGSAESPLWPSTCEDLRTAGVRCGPPAPLDAPPGQGDAKRHPDIVSPVPPGSARRHRRLGLRKAPPAVAHASVGAAPRAHMERPALRASATPDTATGQRRHLPDAQREAPQRRVHLVSSRRDRTPTSRQTS